MRSFVLLSVFLSLNMNLFGQIKKFENIPNDNLVHLKEMGVDNTLSLNIYESDYLNLIFKDSIGNFNFTGKKVGFITGSSGKTKSSKKEYFDTEKDNFSHNYSPNGGTIFIFDKNQKRESGGYDAVIVYWCKFKLQTKDLLKILKK